MLFRNILLAIGALFVFAGLGFLLIWFSQMRTPPPAIVGETQVETKAEILAAARAIPVGTLLRKDDIAWKALGSTAIGPGYLLRGQTSEAEFLGAISRRDFSDGEPLIASDFIKPGDTRFLTTVLKPKTRAVSIFVDAAQSSAGLALPGDRVDVMLIQIFADSVTPYVGRRAVGETILRDVRVIAVDQTLNPPSYAAATATTTAAAAVSPEVRLPRTITLELFERQAEKLLVAVQLGKFQLAVRPLESAGAPSADAKHKDEPVWASDVSQAINEIPPPPQAPRNCDPGASMTGSTLECSIRRPAGFFNYRAPLAVTAVSPGAAPQRPNNAERPQP
jgi:pilus assembly protein CpaB